MDSLSFGFKYAWAPFTFQSRHLTFQQHTETRLTKTESSHWGPAIYKWEGPVSDGEHSGQIGVLIGEAHDLRQRLKQYISGTQESGNKYWREQFLTKGAIRLYILELRHPTIQTEAGQALSVAPIDLASKNVRLVPEQLLVFAEVARKDAKRWIVNRNL